MKFTIPYPPTKAGRTAWNKRYGLNAYYSGKHWQARKKDAETLHTLALLSMKKAGIRKRLLPYPVEITFRWDDGLDIDNHAVLGKAFVDAMKGYILRDDTRRFLRRVTHEFWDGGCMEVEIKTVH